MCRDQETKRPHRTPPKTQKNWPENKLELITKHRKVFSEYIASTDFDSLKQKSDKQDSDRECRVYIEGEMYKREIYRTEKNCDDCEYREINGIDTVQQSGKKDDVLRAQ